MKIRFTITLLLVFVYSFGQNNLFSTTFSNSKELNFYSVKNSKSELTEEELKGFEIIDTINKPYSLVIKNTASVFIAIKNENRFDVYPLLNKEGNNNQKIELNDTLQQTSEKDTLKKKLNSSIIKIQSQKEICFSHLQITDKKSISLDKFKNSELILKFFNTSYCCPTCAIPLNKQASEGYVIFDFDKLHVLEITTRSSIQFVSNGIPQKDMKIEFEKNYLKIGKRKYFYKSNKLVRK